MHSANKSLPRVSSGLSGKRPLCLEFLWRPRQKHVLCRELEERLSANNQALGKEADSGSDIYKMLVEFVFCQFVS
jgi:hypothetical protein